MEMEVKIKVQMSDGVEIVMTEEEARALYTSLKRLFGENNTFTIPYYPVYKDWNAPTITYYSGDEYKANSQNVHNSGYGAEVPQLNPIDQMKQFFRDNN